MMVHGSVWHAWTLVGPGFLSIAIPAVIAGVSAIAKHKGESKAANAAVTAEEARCHAENQRRAAMGNAVASAYGLDTKSAPIAALLAPRPCAKSPGSAGMGYSLLSDLTGGASMLTAQLMNKPKEPGSEWGTGGMGESIPGVNGVPCPPSTIKDPVTGECISPSDMFPGEGESSGTGVHG